MVVIRRVKYGISVNTRFTDIIHLIATGRLQIGNLCLSFHTLRVTLIRLTERMTVVIVEVIIVVVVFLLELLKIHFTLYLFMY
jgi:hypothetical protein